ncbi:hypothetical protein ADENT20671_0410 [Actinomyces denticolens]|nr:hypothetical protein ADENT20671_0410 [Actinomyces denticolens]
MPATTPKRREAGSLRPKSSKTLSRPAVPARSADWSMVSSYMSVMREVDSAVGSEADGAPGVIVMTTT